MNHEEYRQSMLSDPRRPTTAMLAHLSECPACEAYTDELMRFEDRLIRALRVAVPDVATPDAAASGPGPAHVRPSWSGRRTDGRHRLRRGLAVAASVVVALVLGGGLWLGSAGKTLAAAVVGHMAGEPQAWVRTAVAVPQSQLEQVMAASSMHLKPGAGQLRGSGVVSYANSCDFRGHRVPHLVVQTAAGPVTVMVLTQERVYRATDFDEQGYRGVIMPMPEHGSLAVLERGGRSDAATLQRVAADVQAAIEWHR